MKSRLRPSIATATEGGKTWVIRFDYWQYNLAWDQVVELYERGEIGQLIAAELIEQIRKVAVA